MVVNADLPPPAAADSAGFTNFIALYRRPIAIFGLVALACLLPFLVSDFRTFQLTLALAYMMALLGLNLVTGYNGQFSLGHGAFFAVGAYATAVMMDRWGVPYYLTIVPAGFITLIVGFLVGLPASRLEGLYLALATFGLALSMPPILKKFEGLTGGVQGIVLTKPDPPFGLPLSADQWLYFFTLAILLVLFWLAWNLLRGRTGRSIVAIRDHHVAAEAMGVNTTLNKALIFGVSGFFTGVGGAVFAIAIQFVAPDSFTLFLSITLLVGSVVGGIASLSGAIYGGVFIVFIPNFANDISQAAPWAIYGIFLIAFMYLMPNGIAGFISLAWRWIGRILLTRT